jgi:cytoskeleton protein RodZ
MTKVTHLTLDDSGGLKRRRIHLREISGEADAPLETVGQDLRAARLRRGDDLATVSKVLKIRKDHLEALEEDRFKALPGRTYAVGFVRSYADYLGLDPVQCVERFKAEIAGRDDVPPPMAFGGEDEERKLPQGWVIIAVFVVALIAYGLYHLAVSADNLLRQPVEPVPTRMAPQVAARHPAAPPPAKPAVSAPVTLAPTQQLAPPPAADQGSAPAGTNTAQPAPGTAPATGQTANDIAAQGAALPQGTVYGQLNRDPRVVLRAFQTTRVLVEGTDGTVFINRTLKPGDTYQVPNYTGLTLSTPNGGAVQMILDGQAMGFAGKASKMTEALSLDPQDIADRFSHGGGR